MKGAFTLLELIIVIVIVGVLASLALPRFARYVEYSRSAEALLNLKAVRGAMERCYLQRGAYIGCDETSFEALGIDNPNTSPTAHFVYTIGAQTDNSYRAYAFRNSYEGGGYQGDFIRLELQPWDQKIRIDGNGLWQGI